MRIKIADSTLDKHESNPNACSWKRTALHGRCVQHCARNLFSFNRSRNALSRLWDSKWQKNCLETRGNDLSSFNSYATNLSKHRVWYNFFSRLSCSSLFSPLTPTQSRLPENLVQLDETFKERDASPNFFGKGNDCKKNVRSNRPAIRLTKSNHYLWSRYQMA